MKKFALVSVCVLSLALAGSVSASTVLNNQAPEKKEAPAAKKEVKKAPEKKMVAKKEVKKPVVKKTTTPEKK